MSEVVSLANPDLKDIGPCLDRELQPLERALPDGTIVVSADTHWEVNEDIFLEGFPDELKDQVSRAIRLLEKDGDAKFGDSKNPLLVSVRSGARVSMPGMMDTVLNLGLNDNTVAGLAINSGDERFAWDSYRRFIQMYGDVVLGVSHHEFEDMS